MARERRKIIQAGTLWMAVQYTAIRGGDQATRREARSQISTPARESLNAKLSWQKLMLILAANFKSSDLEISLTYRPANLPLHKEDADRRLSNFIRAFRKARAADGKQLVYVRVTEGYHSDGRLHHHLIINSTGNDFKTVRDLWEKNGDDIDFEEFGFDGPERWAKYLTKEPREKGRRHVGDRTWRTSRNIKRPVPSSELVNPGDDLIPPPGAFVFERTETENVYGKFCHIMARLPEIQN